MKLYLFLFALSLFFISCDSSTHRLKVAASPDPQARMLEVIRPQLKKEGIDLEIIEIDDYTLANRLLHEKQVDANFFQHIPYLEKEKELFGYDIIPVAQVHLEPLGIYSLKIPSLLNLKNKAIVALPCDPSNEGRALKLLEKLALIKVKDRPETIRDIVENPRNLQFKEIDASLLPRLLKDVDLALIPGNYALQAKLPTSYRLACEEGGDEYINVIAIRREDVNRFDIQALSKAMRSLELKKFIETEYKDYIVPIF